MVPKKRGMLMKRRIRQPASRPHAPDGWSVATLTRALGTRKTCMLQLFFDVEQVSPGSSRAVSPVPTALLRLRVSSGCGPTADP